MATTWKYDSTSLSTYGKVWMVDGYPGMPPKRGNDYTLPFQHGAVATAKYYASRVITFGIVIQESTPALFQAQLEALQTLLSPRAVQPLEVTTESGSIRTAQATLDGELTVDYITDRRAKVIFGLTLADPFFYAGSLTSNTTTIDATPKTYSVSNPGTVEARKITITLEGPLEDPTITANGVSLTYTGALIGGDTVVIDTTDPYNYTAIKNGTDNVIGAISNSGSSALMVLEAGSNSISVTSVSPTTGTVSIDFYAPFL